MSALGDRRFPHGGPGRSPCPLKGNRQRKGKIMCHDKLTLADAAALAEIVRTVQLRTPVARVIDSNVIYGQARRIGDQSGASMHDTDIRDQYLWVTTDRGNEAFWPVRDLMAEIVSGEFIPNYERYQR